MGLQFKNSSLGVYKIRRKPFCEVMSVLVSFELMWNDEGFCCIFTANLSSILLSLKNCFSVLSFL